MAITFVASVGAALGPSGGTTGAFNTTGATLVVVSVSFNNLATPAVTDSKGNTYTGLTVRGTGAAWHRLFYTLAPTVGTGHTITVSGTTVYASVVAVAFAGVATYDGQQSGATSTTSPLACGSVMPPTSGALVVTGLSGDGAGMTDTVPSGFTGLTTVPFGPGNNYQASAAYRIQTAAAASNPSWAWAGGTRSAGAGSVAVFGPVLPAGAITVVQSTPKVAALASTSVAVTFGTPPTIGHGIVVAVLWTSAGALTCTDTAGNIYTLAKTQTVSGVGEDLWACPAITATATPFTVTAVGASAQNRTAIALEISGPIAVDQTAGQGSAGSTTAVAGPTAALTANDVLFVAAMATAGTPASITVAAVIPPWTQQAEALATVSGEIDSRAHGAALGTTQSVTWTLGSAHFTAAAIVAFKAGTPAVLTVPNVVGLTESAAGAALTAAGLTKGTVTTAPSDTIPAGEVISQSPAAGASVTIGTAVDLVISTGPARWKLLIDGVEQTDAVDAVSMTFVLNERARMTVVVADLLPDKFAEIVSYAKDGVTPLFGGVILTRHFTGRNQYDPDFTCTIECGDFFTYTDWVHVTRTYTVDVTLKAVLEDLVANELDLFSITLDPAQATGPTLAPFTWTTRRVSDAIRELSDRTGYVATISPAKLLRLFVPGTDAAPYAITEGAPHAQELSWADTDQIPATEVIVVAGPTGVQQVADERHYGDGVTRIFALYAPFVQIIGALSRSDDVGGWPVGIYGVDIDPSTGTEYAYSYDPAINSIRQQSDQPIVPVGEYLWLWYMASFPFQVSATCDGSPGPPFPIQQIVTKPDVLSIPVAQEIADSLALVSCRQVKELALTTDEDGFMVGQALTVDLPTTRTISGDFVITDVAMTIVLDTDQGDAYWQYTMKGIESTVYRGSYLDDWRALTGGGRTSTAASGGGTAPGTGGTGGGPHHTTHETGGLDEVLFPSGLRERGRTVPLGEWTPYTVTWVSNGTAPVIGNGALLGRYSVVGKTCTVYIAVTAGSTTTFGTGTYGWSLPFPFVTALTGAAWIFHGGVGPLMGTLTHYSFFVGGPADKAAILLPQIPATLVGATNPYPWVNGDIFILMTTYEIA